jgi:hypothetical protein
MNNQKLIYLPLWILLLTLNTYTFGMEEKNHPQVIIPKPFKLVVPMTTEQYSFHERILLTIQILPYRPLIEACLKEK